VDVAPAACELGSLSHRAEPEVTGGAHPPDIAAEAQAVVPDLDEATAFVRRDPHRDLGSLGMLGDVREPLLRDAV
jgi:hypothetical protein